MKVKYIGPLSLVEFGGFGIFERNKEIEVEDHIGLRLLKIGAFKEIVEEPDFIEEHIHELPDEPGPHEHDYYDDHNNNNISEPVDESDNALESENIESEETNKEEDE